MSDWFTEYLQSHMPGGGWAWDAPTQPGPSDQLLIPQKHAMVIEVSDELLMDAGLIPDTRPPRPPVPWRRRLRWRWQDARIKAAERAYRLIAGYEPPGGEE